MTEEDPLAARDGATRALTHHLPRSIQALLAVAAREGTQPNLTAFEARIASDLGKPAAAFFPTGIMAQQIALRVWCDRARNPNIAFHPTSHLELHEHKAYAMLHRLRALHVGTSTRLITVDDVRAIVDPLGAFLFELPQHELSSLLPHWNDLVLMTDAARRTGAKLHLDGTRLWQAAPHYRRTHAEIADLFDSAYVSFDMGLESLVGGMLIGDKDFIAEVRLWRERQGGSTAALPLLALAAQVGFEREIDHMAAYAARARELAAAFARIDGVVPNAPQTNAFHVFLRGERDVLEARARAYARDTGTWVFGRLASTVVPGIQKWEFVVGEATMALDTEDILEAVRAVMGLGRRDESVGPKGRTSRSKRQLGRRIASGPLAVFS